MRFLHLRNATLLLMRCRHVFLAAAVGIALFDVSPAAAQILTTTTVSYNVRGEVKANGSGFVSPTYWGGQDFKQAFVVGVPEEMTLQEEWETSVSNAINGEASAQASVYAKADIGALHVRLSGAVLANTNASTGRPTDLRYATARMTTSNVQARWQDTAVLNVDGALNRSIVMYASINLLGNMDVNVSDPVVPPNTSYVFTAGAEGNFALQFTSATIIPTPPYAGGVWAQAFDGTNSTPIDNAVPHVIPLRLVLKNGVPFTLDYTLAITGTAGVNLGTTSTSPLTAASYFDADYSNSLYWGGITSVQDAQTGEVIENWSITSSSGVDYRHAVSEPSSPTGQPTLILTAVDPPPAPLLHFRLTGLPGVSHSIESSESLARESWMTDIPGIPHARLRSIRFHRTMGARPESLLPGKIHPLGRDCIVSEASQTPMALV